MQTLNKYEVAWAAGFFDGEGHIAFKKGKYPDVRMDIRQTDVRVLERFKNAVGGVGALCGPYRQKNPNAKDYYALGINGHNQAQAVVAMLWQFLSPVKRVQAKNALTTYNQFPKLTPGLKSKLTKEQVYEIRDKTSNLKELADRWGFAVGYFKGIRAGRKLSKV